MPINLRRAWVPAGVALLAACCFFPRAAFTSDTFLTGDLLRVYYPVHQYWASRVAAGGFPGWYPYDGLGQPFAGMLVSGAFHPSNLLFLVLPLGAAMKWSLLGAYAAAAWGMYLLVRGARSSPSSGALAGATYAFCGYSVSISNNLVYLLALAALPWVFWTARAHLERPSFTTRLSGALSLALVLFAGDAQAFTVAAGCVGVLALLPSNVSLAGRCLRAVELCALGALVGAVQLGTSLAVRQEAFGSVNPTEAALRWSGEPVRLLEVLLGPLWLDSDRSHLLSTQLGTLFEPRLAAPWVVSQYVGVPVVLLALWALVRARKSRAAWCVAAGFVMLVALWLGRHAGLYLWLHEALPFFRAFRYPEKLSPFPVLVLCFAGALGLEHLTAARTRERRPFLALLGGTLAAVLLAAVWEARTHGFSHGLMTSLVPQLTASAQQGLGHNFLFWSVGSAVGLALIGLCLAFLERGAWAAWGVVGVCTASLYLAHGAIPGIGAPEVLTEHPGFLSSIEALDGPTRLGGGRVVSHVAVAVGEGGGPTSNAGMTVRGSRANYESMYQALALRSDVNELFGLETGDAYLPAATRRLMSAYKPFADGGLFGTRYIVMPQQTFEQLHWPRERAVSASPVGLLLARTPGYVERVYLAHPRCVDTAASAVRGVHAPEFRRGLDVMVECDPTLPLEDASGDGSLGTARLQNYEPERVVVRTSASKPAMLVLNDAYYSGWSAKVDGQATKIMPANGTVRAVAVPQGEHEVTFSYRPPGLLPGAGLSLLTLGGLACGLILERRRRAA